MPEEKKKRSVKMFKEPGVFRDARVKMSTTPYGSGIDSDYCHCPPNEDGKHVAQDREGKICATCHKEFPVGDPGHKKGKRRDR